MSYDPRFVVGDDWRIPIEDGQAVDTGWPEETGAQPWGVTWHWTATWDLDHCNRLLGGRDAQRKGAASAHFGIGRSFAEGVERYVSLDDRSYHAGVNQSLRWDGRAKEREAWKGARTTIGVETVAIGYATDRTVAGADWLEADSVDGHHHYRIQPWTDEQIEMMIAIGRLIVERWPQIGPDDHHGHHDLCPLYKQDVLGFPFARVLRGIYDQPSIADPWSSTWTVRGRRQVLALAGYPSSVAVDDDVWYRADDLALRRFQRDHDLHVNGFWNTWTARAAHRYSKRR